MRDGLGAPPHGDGSDLAVGGEHRGVPQTHRSEDAIHLKGRLGVLPAGCQAGGNSSGPGDKITLTILPFGEWGYDKLLDEYPVLHPELTIKQNHFATSYEAKERFQTGLAGPHPDQGADPRASRPSPSSSRPPDVVLTAPRSSAPSGGPRCPRPVRLPPCSVFSHSSANGPTTSCRRSRWVRRSPVAHFAPG